MAKTKQEKKNLQEVLDELNKKYNYLKDETFFVSTGSLGLDVALGGGFASGRISEIIAWEGSGKTTVALHAVADAQSQGKKVAYIDAEHALSKKYAEALGVKWEELLIFQPSTGEEAFDTANEIMRTGEIDMIVFDSTSGMIPKKQLEAEAGEHHLGLHARLFSAEVPKTNSLCSVHNVCLIYISQVREKIGVLFGSPETTQCGNALRFFSSNRIELRRTVEKAEKGENSKRQQTRFKTLKCKTNSPFITGAFDIVFSEGIDQIEELMELLNDYGFIKKWGNTITYNEDKYPLEDFYNMIVNNPEFKDELKIKVINKLKGIDAPMEVTPEA